jgi:predicted transcriptional regulator
MIIRRRITIIRASPPRKQDVNQGIMWFGHALGLFSERDKDSSLYRLFVELIKNRQHALSSDELALRLDLSRGTIVHHLNKLLAAGIITSERSRYQLRDGNLELLVEELKRDIKKAMDDLRDVARQIDESL